MPAIFICDKCNKRSHEYGNVPDDWHVATGSKFKVLCPRCNKLRLRALDKKHELERLAGFKKHADKPLKMRKGNTIYERTMYGSYVNPADDGMAQEKNAKSYKDLIKYGYKPVK